MTAFRAYSWFLLRRLGMTVFTLLGLVTLVFLMVKLIPGDEAQMAAGADASTEQVEAIRDKLGLNAPVYIQYFVFIGRVLRFDLGNSIVTSQPVVDDLAVVLGSTMELVFFAMIINLAVSIPTAIFAAYRRGSHFDNFTRVSAVILGGMPIFWLALILQYLLGSVWRILPISGQQSFGVGAPAITGTPTLDAILALDGVAFFDALYHIVLPATVLSVMFSAQIFRTLRSSLLGVLKSDFITAVHAKGGSPNRMLFRHALPNSLNPVLSLAGTQAGLMIGAAVLVETVFARRGIGAYLFNAVAQKDSFAVLGSVLFIGFMVSMINLLVDVAQLVLDPRIRAAQMGSQVQ